MDKFIVSARKYRPQTFDTVVGQGSIVTTLRNAIKNQQLAHAFLFCGPRGVGKTTCARILAKTINCENKREDGEACDVCHSCVSFNEGTSMNIHELDAASNNSVDDIRALVEQVRFAPQAGKYKVYIIDEVHMLSSSAFNAFLKTLEEPPSYAIFILATTEKHKILPTILSRCQIFDFKRITAQDTVDHLLDICKKENIQAEPAALHVIAQKSEGCMRDSLSIMDKIVSFSNGTLDYANTIEHLNILDEDYYFKLLDFVQQQDLGGSFLLYDDINRKGFEGDTVLNGFAEFLRNLLICKDSKVAQLLEVVESFKEKYFAVAQQTSPSWLISALNLLNDAEMGYKMARNKRLHIEMLLIKLTYLNQALDLTGQEGSTKKKLNPEAKPLAFKKIASITSVPTKKEASKVQSTIVPEIPATAKLVIENPVPEVAAPKIVAPTSSATTKIGKLDQIRKQVTGNQTKEENITIPLTIESLKAQWTAYTDRLKDLKSPAVQSFEIAQLEVLDDQTFEVRCTNNLEQKFIEQERVPLSDFLQKAFNNKMLIYNIGIDESMQIEEHTERPLTIKEQYLKISEMYPLVKELRERLRLDMD